MDPRSLVAAVLVAALLLVTAQLLVTAVIFGDRSDRTTSGDRSDFR